MELETIRIELPGGAYAVVYKDVLRKTARMHEAELRKYMTPYNPAGDPTKVLRSALKANPALGGVDYYIDFVAVDDANDQINEIFILNQTREWSFGPITAEVLETVVSRDQYQALVQEVDRLYKPSPLPGKPLETSVNGSSGPSSSGRPSRPKQGMLTISWKWMRRHLL